MKGFDSSQFKYAQTLDEAMKFGLNGYSHKLRNYNFFQRLLAVKEFEKQTMGFDRDLCRGVIQVKYKSAALSLDTDVTLDNTSAERHTIMLRLIEVPFPDRRKGYFKKMVALVSGPFKDAPVCLLACLGPYSMGIDPKWNDAKSETLKDKMEKIFYNNGRLRIKFDIAAYYGGEILDRTNKPDPNRLFILLNKSPDNVQRWYRSMRYYEDEKT